MLKRGGCWRCGAAVLTKYCVPVIKEAEHEASLPAKSARAANKCAKYAVLLLLRGSLLIGTAVTSVMYASHAGWARAWLDMVLVASALYPESSNAHTGCERAALMHVHMQSRWAVGATVYDSLVASGKLSEEVISRFDEADAEDLLCPFRFLPNVSGEGGGRLHHKVICSLAVHMPAGSEWMHIEFMCNQ